MLDTQRLVTTCVRIVPSICKTKCNAQLSRVNNGKLSNYAWRTTFFEFLLRKVRLVKLPRALLYSAGAEVYQSTVVQRIRTVATRALHAY